MPCHDRSHSLYRCSESLYLLLKIINMDLKVSVSRNNYPFGWFCWFIHQPQHFGPLDFFGMLSDCEFFSEPSFSYCWIPQFLVMALFLALIVDGENSLTQNLSFQEYSHYDSHKLIEYKIEEIKRTHEFIVVWQNIIAHVHLWMH